MNYWCVSQNQTHKQEIGGGYMWSPKADKNGKPVQSYTNMTKVSVGNLVFAFTRAKSNPLEQFFILLLPRLSQRNLAPPGITGQIPD